MYTHSYIIDVIHIALHVDENRTKVNEYVQCKYRLHTEV